jgi:hypothetical protein
MLKDFRETGIDTTATEIGTVEKIFRLNEKTGMEMEEDRKEKLKDLK